MKRRDFLKIVPPAITGAALLPTIANVASTGTKAQTPSFGISSREMVLHDGDVYFNIRNQSLYTSKHFIRNKVGLHPTWIKIN